MLRRREAALERAVSNRLLSMTPPRHRVGFPIGVGNNGGGDRVLQTEVLDSSLRFATLRMK